MNNFDIQLQKTLKQMSFVQIINFVQQVYSNFSNFSEFEFGDFRILFYTYCSVLKDYNTNPTFKKSLENNMIIFDLDLIKLMKTIENLEQNNQNSFILLPITTVNHAFCTTIYKRSDSEYELIIINKGYTNSESGKKKMYEKYILKSSDIERFIEKFVFFGSFKVVDVYDFLEKTGRNIKNEESILNNIGIDSSIVLQSLPQKEGNCFYKNPEAAFTFAWFLANPKFQKTYLMDNKKFLTPKGPANTLEIHNQIINKLCDAIKIAYVDNTELKENLLNEIAYQKRIYNVNKKLKKYSSTLSDTTSTLKQDLLRICEANSLRECFSLMDNHHFSVYSLKFITNNILDKNIDKIDSNDLQEISTILNDISNIWDKKITKKVYKKIQQIDFKYDEFIKKSDLTIFYAVDYFLKKLSIKLLFSSTSEKYIDFLDKYIFKTNDNNSFEKLNNFRELYVNIPHKVHLIKYLSHLNKKNTLLALDEINRYLEKPLFKNNLNYLFEHLNNFNYSNIFDDIQNQTNWNDAFKYYILALSKSNIKTPANMFKYYLLTLFNYNNKTLLNDFTKENYLKAFKLNPKFIDAHFNTYYSRFDQKNKLIISELIYFLLENEPNDINFKIQLISVIDTLSKKDLMIKDFEKVFNTCKDVLQYDKYNYHAHSVYSYYKVWEFINNNIKKEEKKIYINILKYNLSFKELALLENKDSNTIKNFLSNKKQELDTIKKLINAYKKTHTDNEKYLTDTDFKIIINNTKILEKISEYNNNNNQEMLDELVKLLNEHVIQDLLKNFSKEDITITNFLDDKNILPKIKDKFFKELFSAKDTLKFILTKRNEIQLIRKIQELININYNYVERIIESNSKIYKKVTSFYDNNSKLNNKLIELINTNLIQDIEHYFVGKKENIEKIINISSFFILASNSESLKNIYDISSCLVTIQETDDNTIKENQINIINEKLNMGMNLLENPDKLIDLFIEKDKNTIFFARGYTLLNYAIEMGNTNMVKLLIEHGVDINKRDLYNNSPIGLAIKNLNFKILYILLKQRIINIYKLIKNNLYNNTIQNHELDETPDIKQNINEKNINIPQKHKLAQTTDIKQNINEKNINIPQKHNNSSQLILTKENIRTIKPSIEKT